jgi:hypothetical protein
MIMIIVPDIQCIGQYWAHSASFMFASCSSTQPLKVGNNLLLLDQTWGRELYLSVCYFKTLVVILHIKRLVIEPFVNHWMIIGSLFHLEEERVFESLSPMICPG